MDQKGMCREHFVRELSWKLGKQTSTLPVGTRRQLFILPGMV